jgi:hypothetical protein
MIKFIIVFKEVGGGGHETGPWWYSRTHTCQRSGARSAPVNLPISPRFLPSSNGSPTLPILKPAGPISLIIHGLEQLDSLEQAENVEPEDAAEKVNA